MSIALFILLIVSLCVCAYRHTGVKSTAVVAVVITLLHWLITGFSFLTFLMLLPTAILAVLASPLRQSSFSPSIFKWFKQALPEISPTEQAAIDAGTVWWDGDLFSGKPDWQKLLQKDMPKVSAEEQAFLDKQVNQVCRMADAWNINHNTSEMPKEIEQYLYDEGFLGMIIPKAYGGLEFSATAQSEVLSRLAAAGSFISTFVAVPNSLGPGELLLKYGTEEQKNHYLPRLAKGQDVPCFALTGPLAGSDATSIPDRGVVCKGQFNGKEVVGIRLNFEKRYITLAPVATVVGLAFQLSDPDHLLGDENKTEYGITCALIPRETDGISIGRRHKPIGDPFLNGPIFGKDVFIPLDYIIGGAERAGFGWTMLVNCLSVGRCITLPSGSNGAAKYMLMGTSGYAALRQQFGLPVAMFEGVQKPLARIAGYSYIINAACQHTIQMLDYGEKPSVASAILKYHTTEMARQTIIDAMDIHGGKAIMEGPKNYVASAYSSIPVMITVEGANIMTRNLMIFGQGATRSHPYVLDEMVLAGKEANSETLNQFDEVFWGHVGFSVSNIVRSFVMGLTGGRFTDTAGNTQLAAYYHQLNRLSTAFAMVADISMLTLQSKLKFKEMLSARLGDLLSYLFMASMVLKHYENEGCPADERPVLDWSMQHLLHQYQVAMQEIIDNYPNRVIAVALGWLVFPLGKRFAAPSDKLSVQVARLFSQNTPLRDRHLANCFAENLPTYPLGQVNTVFKQQVELKPLFDKIREAIKAGKIEKALGAKQIELAQAADVVSHSEAEQLLAFDAALMEIIHVDHFEHQELVRYQADTASAESPKSDKAA